MSPRSRSACAPTLIEHGERSFVTASFAKLRWTPSTIAFSPDISGFEYGFVDTAARALGYAVAKAPSFQERRRLGLGLYGLVTDQEQVFVDAFDRMGAPANERTGLAPQGLALPLHALFLKVAETEGYEEILACTLAAEWMYLTWCSMANKSPSSKSVIRDWVALHAGGPFADHVAWVRSEIDTRGPTVTDARQARLGALFEETLQAEIAFHDAPYAG
jgi:thiaminase/transcriptional activator TenA